MRYKAVSALAKSSACVVVGLFESNQWSIAKGSVDSKTRAWLRNWVKKEGFVGSAGKTLLLRDAPGHTRVLVAGLGNKDDFNGQGLARAVTASLDHTQVSTASMALKLGGKKGAAIAKTIVEESEYAQYHYQRTISHTPEVASLHTIQFFAVEAKEKRALNKAIKQAQAIGEGVNVARELGNTPANLMTPSDLVKQARLVARGNAAMKVKVLSEAQMEKLGMGSLLSVSAGSNQPAKLIVLEYYGAKRKSDKPYALVGKGVTFDTGGISLKPGAGMDEMKFDMCGAASVLGVFQALAKLKLPINVVGVVPATENMPNGQATKPGDVVTSMSGQTIEVLNTDAEGRLILCDALTYVGKYKPQQVIDIATLTGACVVALGHHVSGLMANDDALAEELLAAGKQADDQVWRLPLADVDKAYDKQLSSNFADMANIGGKGAGTVTAGCFLARFTGEYNWAHLDIAGTAWQSGAKKGATGRPVKLLLQYLINKG